MNKDFSLKTVKYDELLEKFKQLLRENRLKFTTQRAVILEVLYDFHTHLTPEELHKIIQARYPHLKVGIATVYRTLSLLENAQLVTSISFGTQGKKYELGAKEHHDHMICTECGLITEFVDEEIEKRQEKIAREFGFLMRDHSMQIYGICQSCQENKTKD